VGRSPQRGVAGAFQPGTLNPEPLNLFSRYIKYFNLNRHFSHYYHLKKNLKTARPDSPEANNQNKIKSTAIAAGGWSET
jgi:hypothetical protein